MEEERMKILNMLGDGSISAEEAHKLLDALESTKTASAAGNQDFSSEDDIKAQMPSNLHVLVEPKNKEGDGVRIKIPLQLLKAGIKLASLLPSNVQSKVTEALESKGIGLDFKNLQGKQLDEFIAAMSNTSIDIDAAEEKVKIYFA